MTDERFALLYALKPNDVIRLNGTLRVVRTVKWRNERKRGRRRDARPRGIFTFVILHCSWTGRCYTCYTSSDLAQKPIELIARNFRSKNAALEQQILHNIHHALDHPTLSCCDVHGIY